MGHGEKIASRNREMVEPTRVDREDPTRRRHRHIATITAQPNISTQIRKRRKPQPTAISRAANRQAPDLRERDGANENDAEADVAAVVDSARRAATKGSQSRVKEQRKEPTLSSLRHRPRSLVQTFPHALRTVRAPMLRSTDRQGTSHRVTETTDLIVQPTDLTRDAVHRDRPGPTYILAVIWRPLPRKRLPSAAQDPIAHTTPTNRNDRQNRHGAECRLVKDDRVDRSRVVTGTIL